MLCYAMLCHAYANKKKVTVSSSNHPTHLTLIAFDHKKLRSTPTHLRPTSLSPPPSIGNSNMTAPRIRARRRVRRCLHLTLSHSTQRARTSISSQTQPALRATEVRHAQARGQMVASCGFMTRCDARTGPVGGR